MATACAFYTLALINSKLYRQTAIAGWLCAYGTNSEADKPQKVGQHSPSMDLFFFSAEIQHLSDYSLGARYDCSVKHRGQITEATFLKVAKATHSRARM
jgi:hypothetical protein